MSGPDGDAYTFTEICRALGKSHPYVRNLQRTLALTVTPEDRGYSRNYLNLLEKVVSLRAFNIPLADIDALFTREKRILELLHFDTVVGSPEWYLDACVDMDSSDARLLLTGFDLGFPLHAREIQGNLDFGMKQPELFSGREMGEDVRRVLRLYLSLLSKVRDKVRCETPVLVAALDWSQRAFSFREASG